MNLKTSKERVNWLKNGFDGKHIENAYIILNYINIVRDNTLREINI